MYRTRVFGEQTDTVVIETEGKHSHEIKAKDAIVKLWFSDGTILGIQYNTRSKIWKDTWKIIVLNRGFQHWAFHQINNPTFQINNPTLTYYSDEYTLDADLVNFKVIPRTHYDGDGMNDGVV